MFQNNNLSSNNRFRSKSKIHKYCSEAEFGEHPLALSAFVACLHNTLHVQNCSPLLLRFLYGLLVHGGLVKLCVEGAASGKQVLQTDHFHKRTNADALFNSFLSHFLGDFQRIPRNFIEYCCDSLVMTNCLLVDARNQSMSIWPIGRPIIIALNHHCLTSSKAPIEHYDHSTF